MSRYGAVTKRMELFSLRIGQFLSKASISAWAKRMRFRAEHGSGNPGEDLRFQGTQVYVFLAEDGSITARLGVTTMRTSCPLSFQFPK
jgi:hypothetical protein